MLLCSDDRFADVGDSSMLLGDELAVNHGDSLDTVGGVQCASSSWPLTSTYK